MKRLILLAGLFCALALNAFGQTNYTTVTGSRIQYINGSLVPRGRVCFQGADASGTPMNFQVGGGGQAVNSPYCTNVVNGVIQPPMGLSSFQVANPDNTIPAGVLYVITIAATNQTIYTCKGALLSGASFNFDTFVCPNVSLPPNGGAVNGPLWVQGNVNISGTLSFGACPLCGGSFTRYYPSEIPNGAITVFHFAAAAASSIRFELLWNGLLMNEGDDYTIAIGGGVTTVTLYRPAQTNDHIIAYF